ncbi:hypothetical protein ACHWQZ_G016705 [Mnemiopsis leidyi]
MATNITRKEIQQLGKRILEKSISCRGEYIAETEPTMLPPIPDSRFIDKIPRDQESKGKNRRIATERGHQIGYEAEVKLYRSFEKLRRNLIVIHHLEYTHEQYSSFIPKHLCDSKSCKAGTSQCSKMDKRYSWQSSEDSLTGADHQPPVAGLPLQEHPCHNKPNNKDGECDFVVIGKGFVAVLR